MLLRGIKRRALSLFVLILCIGAIGVYFWFFDWEQTQCQIVFSCDGERFEVKERRQRSLHVVVGHFPLGHLRPGRTEVSLTSELGGSYSFKGEEDMILFAVHQVGREIYLVFVTVYSERRFAFYKYDVSSRKFLEILPAMLPHEAAYPNFGQELLDAHRLLSAETKVCMAIRESYIGWLWNLIIVGEIRADDAQALEYFMGNFRDEFLDKMAR